MRAEDVADDRNAVRAQALRMLLRVAGGPSFGAVAQAKGDAMIRRLLALGATEQDIRNALGCTQDELIAALWRIAN